MDRNQMSELISAYLDGEATPAERAEVEQLLETSPELRSEMDDFARLSDLLRALPRETAPASLAASVRQQAEQQSLLNRSPAMAKRSYLREVFAALSGIAVTAAAWLITVQTAEFQGSPARESSRNGIALGVPFTATGPDASEDVVLAQRDNRNSMLADSVVQEQGILVSGDAKAGPARPFAAKAAAAPPLPGEAARWPDAGRNAQDLPEFAAGAGGMGGMLGGLGADNDTTPYRVRIGEVLPYMEQTGNGVGVIEVTVVDFREAGDRLEVLLQQNGLQVLGDAESVGEAKAQSASADAPPQLTGKPKSEFGSKKSKGVVKDRERMMVVYVDAPRQTIANVLDEMASEGWMRQTNLQPPVEQLFDDLADEELAADKSGAKAEDYSEAELAAVNTVQEATGLIQNYTQRRLARSLSENDAEVNSAASEAEIQRKSAANLVRSRGMRGDYRSLNRDGRLGEREAGAVAVSESDPSDALTPSNQMPQLQYFSRLQNTFIPVEVDAVTGEVASNSLAQKMQQADRPGIRKEVLETMQKQNSRSSNSAPEERVPAPRYQNATTEPTMRLMIVLQKAATDETP